MELSSVSIPLHLGELLKKLRDTCANAAVQAGLPATAFCKSEMVNVLECAVGIGASVGDKGTYSLQQRCNM